MFYLDAEVKSQNNIQLERQIKTICNQLEIQKENAFKDVKLWLKNGTRVVPSWMTDNAAFTSSLTKIKTVYQYINLINKFGRHFIVNQEQCGAILKNAKVGKVEIEIVKAVITEFWSKSTTSEFFKRENWESFLQIENSVELAIDHPLLYTVDK
jgi:hypothetical protein